jgi:hypothetical protein
MVEGILLLIRHRPAQMQELLKLLLAGPVLLVFCYEIGDNLVPATTVALAALLLCAAYGVLITLVTARIACSISAAETSATGETLATVKPATARRPAPKAAARPEPRPVKAA